ncbi:hypothetical protein C8F04DRAFT_1174808 [Mycena alexandri]|uniref:Uncharacterized protein n=1 Tax=Mycena alexandri TaxID=1745969 RepID=A0AAD6XC07_9AGAR|nr:hypothetical protein C8F04DRAFT_1174808 [Mycena alexandri]
MDVALTVSRSKPSALLIYLSGPLTCPFEAFNVPKSFEGSFNSFNIDPNHAHRFSSFNPSTFNVTSFNSPTPNTATQTHSIFVNPWFLAALRVPERRSGHGIDEGSSIETSTGLNYGPSCAGLGFGHLWHPRL